MTGRLRASPKHKLVCYTIICRKICRTMFLVLLSDSLLFKTYLFIYLFFIRIINLKHIQLVSYHVKLNCIAIVSLPLGNFSS